MQVTTSRKWAGEDISYFQMYIYIYIYIHSYLNSLNKNLVFTCLKKEVL